MTEVDRAKQRAGAEMIEQGLALMRAADPDSAEGVALGWALCFGLAAIDEDGDMSGVHIMLPVEGVSWPLLLGILRGSSLKAERAWLKQMEGDDDG